MTAWKKGAEITCLAFLEFQTAAGVPALVFESSLTKCESDNFVGLLLLVLCCCLFSKNIFPRKQVPFLTRNVTFFFLEIRWAVTRARDVTSHYPNTLQTCLVSTKRST